MLKDNGVVFGAAFDEDFNVKHIFVDKEADMYKLRGSKYLQSRTEDCFAEAKKFLNEGRKVFFRERHARLPAYIITSARTMTI